MSYLHVTVQIKNSDDWVCLFVDLVESELKKKLVKPYRLGKAIYYDGNILMANEISRIKINKTEKNHEEELKIVQNESRKSIQEFNRSNPGFVWIGSAHGYSDYEINECGTDVTSKYISDGPGSGTFGTRIAEFIRHPWVVRIVGGLIFLSIAAYFGFQ